MIILLRPLEAPYVLQVRPTRREGGYYTRFRKPFSPPNSSQLRLTLANCINELTQNATLAGVGWNGLECGGVEHNLSTGAGSPKRQYLRGRGNREPWRACCY